MNKALSLSLLILGTAIAGSFGARNGEQLSQRRAIQAIVTRYEAADQLPEVPDSLNAAQVLQLNPAKREARETEVDRLLASKLSSFEALEADGLLGDPPHPADLQALKPIVTSFLEKSQRERDATPIPSARQRIEQWMSAGGLGWLFGVFLLGAGALMARKQLADEAQGVGQQSTDRVDFDVQIAQILTEVRAIQALIAELPMDTDSPIARERLDHLIAHLIDPLVDARGRFQARHGTALFADYFSPLSSGERNLNRAWSGLTDEHAIVARDALQRALDAFTLAQSSWSDAESALENPSHAQ